MSPNREGPATSDRRGKEGSKLFGDPGTSKFTKRPYSNSKGSLHFPIIALPHNRLYDFYLNSLVLGLILKSRISKHVIFFLHILQYTQKEPDHPHFLYSSFPRNFFFQQQLGLLKFCFQQTLYFISPKDKQNNYLLETLLI